jgi:hypothetical protein
MGSEEDGIALWNRFNPDPDDIDDGDNPELESELVILRKENRRLKEKVNKLLEDYVPLDIKYNDGTRCHSKSCVKAYEVVADYLSNIIDDNPYHPGTNNLRLIRNAINEMQLDVLK